MRSLAHMADMRITDAEKAEDATCMPVGIASKSGGPDYPYGLRISLTERELEKLRLNYADCEVGCLVDLRAFGEVMSISLDKREDKETCRIEIQITHLEAENEDAEDEEPAAKPYQPAPYF